ncbi:MAG: Camelysin metallo-endopeptidase [Blautia sp.]|nr:Camelysin metallo-endopeptidase [Blautia sp.]
MKGKKLTSIVAALAASALMVGTTMAYLTDYDTAANEFTIGSVKVDLEEPDWNPEEHPSVEPGQEVKKNPYIENTGENSFYGYLSVSVPVEKVVLASPDGKRMEAAETPLFTYTALEGWTLVDSWQKDGMKTEVYAYDQILKKGEKSTELFKTVKLVNLVEGQLDGKKCEIPVKAYAIQSEGTGDGKETVPEQAKAAFQKYINQNADTEGKVIGK